MQRPTCSASDTLVQLNTAFFFFFFTDYFSDGGRRERACTRSRGKLVGGNPLNLRQKIEICFVKGLLKCLTVQIQHLRTTSGD